METLIQDCYDKINKDKHSNCKDQLGNNCFRCVRNMYYYDNEIDYDCKNKRLIYIIRFLPVHSAELYKALDSLFCRFEDEIKKKKTIVFASFGAGPGIDTYAFHNWLKNNNISLQCDFFINYRIEVCEKWDYLKRKLMFSNQPKSLTSEYLKIIKNITEPIKMKNKFDIATLSYIISELDDDDINELIKNIKNNKSENSYIIINDRPQPKVKDKIEKIMSELAENSQLYRHHEEHCGFTFPDDIMENCKPKIYRKSIYAIGKLK